MAKYESAITIRGTVDDLTFRKTAEGKIVSTKTGPTREQVLTSERFALTRHNATEFKQTIRSATFLRRALRDVLDGLRCTTFNGHVNGLLHALTRSDVTNDFGHRCAAAGDLSVFNGFQFNRQLSLSSATSMKFAHSLDAEKGAATLSVAPFKVLKSCHGHTAATHFRLVCGVVAINFTTGQYTRDLSFGELLPINRKMSGHMDYTNQIAASSGNALIQVLGIQLFALTPKGPALIRGGAVQIVDAAWAIVQQAPGVQSPGEGEEYSGVDEIKEAACDRMPASGGLAALVAQMIPLQKKHANMNENKDRKTTQTKELPQHSTIGKEKTAAKSNIQTQRPGATTTEKVTEEQGETKSDEKKNLKTQRPTVATTDRHPVLKTVKPAQQSIVIKQQKATANSNCVDTTVDPPFTAEALLAALEAGPIIKPAAPDRPLLGRQETAG